MKDLARIRTGLLALGALAAAAPATAQVFAVDTTDDTVDASTADDLCADANGNCSLRAAVQQANASGGAAILLEGGITYTLTRAGAGEDLAATGDLDVRAPIVLVGDGATVDAAELDRAFDVFASGELDVRRLTVVRGRVLDASGGAYRSNSARLSLSGCHVDDCAASGPGASGGAIFSDGGRVLVRATTLENCTAERAGGAVEVNGGTTTLEISKLLGNSTGPGPGNGGGLHVSGTSEVHVRTSVLRGNSAAREGGGLWNSGTGIMHVFLSELSGNHALGSAADDGGGGLFNDGGFVRADLCRFTGNEALAGSGSGGGVFNNGGTLEVLRSDIADNRANRAGGGLEALGGTTRVLASTLSRNDAGTLPGNGGGLHLTGDGTVRVDGVRFSENRAASEGGGLWNSALGETSVARSIFDGNTASGDGPDQGGGGIFNDGGSLTVLGTSLIGNKADGSAGSGGAILNDTGSLSMTRALIAFNEATRAGGGIEANVGKTHIAGVFLTSNVAGDNPGNGGGVHLTGAGTLTLDRGFVTLNAAASEGGGLWNSATGTMTVTTTVIEGNSAPTGPNVFNDGGTLTIDGVPVP